MTREIIWSLCKAELAESKQRAIAIKIGFERLGLIEQQDFDIVFLELKMPMIDETNFFRQIRALKPELPVTIFTSYTNMDMMARTLTYGPLCIMHKSLGEPDVNSVLTFSLVSQAKNKTLDGG